MPSEVPLVSLLTQGIWRESSDFSRGNSRGLGAVGRRWLVSCSCISFLLLVLSLRAIAADVKLAWDANTEPDLAGYRVRYGGTSGVYTSVVEAGTSTTAVVAGLAPGTRYFFAATAYNSSGLESSPSAEVAYTVPLAPAVSSATVTQESVRPRTVVVSARVSAMGAATDAYVEFGLTSTYGQTTNRQAIGSGADFVSISTSLENLQPHSVYHYRVVVQSIGGTAYGPDGVFTTGNSVPAAMDDQAFSVAAAASQLVIRVLDNDQDPDGDTLVVSRVSRPSAGRVRINADNTITYVPKLSLASFGGADSFSYTIADGFGGVAVGTIVVRNPFYRIKGTYDSLLQGPEAQDGGLGGYVKVTLTNSGAFTGSLALNGNSYSFTGNFDKTGRAVASLPRTGLPSLLVSLALDKSGRSNLVNVLINDGATLYSGDAERGMYNAEVDPCPRAGNYTLLLPVPDDLKATAGVPKGVGYATLSVTENGKTRLVGKQADGTAFSAGANVRRSDTLPIYAGLGGTPAARLYGVLTFEEVTDTSDLDGTLKWVKPAQASGNYYRAGFSLRQPCVGSFYVPPATGERVIDADAGGAIVLDFFGGNLPAAQSQMAVLSSTNALTAQSPTAFAKLSITVAPATGLFSGTFTHPVSAATVAINGVFFQKQNVGAGVFLGKSESGSIQLTPVP